MNLRICKHPLRILFSKMSCDKERPQLSKQSNNDNAFTHDKKKRNEVLLLSNWGFAFHTVGLYFLGLEYWKVTSNKMWL